MLIDSRICLDNVEGIKFIYVGRRGLCLQTEQFLLLLLLFVLSSLVTGLFSLVLLLNQG